MKNKLKVAVGDTVDFYPVDGASHTARGIVLKRIRENNTGKLAWQVRATEGDGAGQTWVCFDTDIQGVISHRDPAAPLFTFKVGEAVAYEMPDGGSVSATVSAVMMTARALVLRLAVPYNGAKYATVPVSRFDKLTKFGKNLFIVTT